MYTPYNIFSPELKKYQNTGAVTGPVLQVGTVYVKDGKTYRIVALRSQTDFDVEDITDKTNVAVDKSSVKKYKDRGISIDFGNVGEDRYVNQQPAESGAPGRHGDATKNEQGWKDTWKDVYPEYDKLINSLPRYATGIPNPEVRKFQKWVNETYIPNNIKIINEQRVKSGYKPLSTDESKALENDLIADYGFNPSKKGKAYDGLWGTFTSSRRPLNYSIDPMDMSVDEDEKDTNTGKEIIPNKPGTFGKIPEVGAFPQDRNNLIGALTDWTGIKKYPPYMRTATLAHYDPTFKDPSAINALIMGQANMGTQGLNAYSNPQAYLAGYSKINADATERAVANMSAINNDNVTIANDAAKYNAEVDSKQALYDAQKTGNYYDQTVMANQQHDNAKRDAKNKTIAAMNALRTHRAYANTLNYMHPYEYYLDPSDGGSIRLNQDNLPKSYDETYKADAQRREEQMTNFLGGKWGKLPDETKWNIYDRLYPSETSPVNYRKQKSQPSNERDLQAYYQMMQQMGLGYDPYGG